MYVLYSTEYKIHSYTPAPKSLSNFVQRKRARLINEFRLGQVKVGEEGRTKAKEYPFDIYMYYVCTLY